MYVVIMPCCTAALKPQDVALDAQSICKVWFYKNLGHARLLAALSCPQSAKRKAYPLRFQGNNRIY